jgi:co-chaperonin GroES (HSP10)
MIRRLIPTANRILVKKIEVEAKTASGILLQKGAAKNDLGN